MTGNKQDLDQNKQNPNNPQREKSGSRHDELGKSAQHQQGLAQEDTGGPGAREKNRNQQDDGQRRQGKENETDPQRR